MKHLKWLRRLVALTVFCATALLFLSDGLLASGLAKILTWPQFAPSLLAFCNQPQLTALAWLAVIILTIFFGRIYCSALCPLGIAQDGATRLFGPKKRRFIPAIPRWHYGIMTLTIVTFIVGHGLILRLLEPFSAFGRILNQIARPVALALRWLAAKILEYFEMYLIAPPSWPPWALSSFAIASFTLVLVAWLAARHGRLYCNSICPFGALFGICAKRAVFAPRIDAAICTGCRQCEAICKADCINARERTVDRSRCVACYNCLSVCKEGALRLRPGQTKGQTVLSAPMPGGKIKRKKPSAARPGKPETARRALLASLGATMACFFLSKRGQAAPDTPIQVPHPEKPTTIPERRAHPVSPPGSIGIAHFTDYCTACQLCVAVCPSRVLSPSLFEFGVDSMMQPRMDFGGGYCAFECVNCLEVCPVTAILPLSLAEKKLIQIGVARFIKENCVVHTEGTACGACSEHCPTKAVDMVAYPHPTKSNLKIPEIKADFCLGCGACEHACPTRPYRAIVVDGNPIHKKAKKPDFKPVAAPSDIDAFPF
ncbi:MAG: 4Fe-4S dicluster domain-containing protein [Desulfobulbaceae bacterium]|jgi:formate hydrogenlyase subunit 6/NADH:ubiquinone oxidoreductase subunit I|nr:4Fe-4S dicluster domain-containing protein [Desulfobulbaceae bacterium]